MAAWRWASCLEVLSRWPLKISIQLLELATSRSQWCAGNHHWDDTGKCCTAGGKLQGSYPVGGNIRHPLLSLTGNLGLLRNAISNDKTLFSSEVLSLPQIFGSFSFSRGPVLQGACLSTGCREVTAREGSQEWSWEVCLEEPLGHTLPHYNWCVPSKHLLLHRTPWVLFTMQVLGLVCNPIGTCSRKNMCCLCVGSSNA